MDEQSFLPGVVSSKPMIEAVVFDAGGTLVRIDFEWISEMLAGLGVEASASELRRSEVHGRRRYDALAGRVPRTPSAGPHPALGSVGPTQAYWSGMLEAAGCRHPVLEEALERLRLRQVPPSFLWARPMEGARAALDALAAMGMRACCVSNSDGRAELHLTTFGMRTGLEFVVDSQLEGVEKPDPRLFFVALEKLGLPADRTVYVGDIRSVDEAGARAAGMHFVLVDPFGDYGDAGQRSLRSLDELPALLASRFTLVPASRSQGYPPKVGQGAFLNSRARETAGGRNMNGTEPIIIDPHWLEAAHAVADPDVPGATVFRRGKVRTVFNAGPGHFVIVASDRLSAYDSVLPTPIPGKGAILSLISAFWMRSLGEAMPHHLVSDEPAEFPSPFLEHADRLRGRAQLVRRAERIDIECVVRGYLTGSGWKEYQRTGTVCGIALPAGLRDGSRLEPAIFTPATKNDTGHDENISFEQMVAAVGLETAAALRERSLAIYEEARAHAWSRSLVLADTKFEFGRIDGRLSLIDEALSPDSSRYWDRAEYEAGRLLSFDKQFVRDWLDASGWNHEPPAPALPTEVVAKTQARYLEAIRRLSGGER